MNKHLSNLSYCTALLLLFCFSACEDAALPSEQVPVTTVVDNEPKPAVPQPAPSKAPPPPSVKDAPSTSASPARSGGNGTMTMENLENIKVRLDVDRLLPPEQLLASVKQSIIPSYKNWVLFKNGTYIILDDISNIPDVAQEALRLLDAYRPNISIDKPDTDYSISHLDKIEGWSVYGKGYGIYTYVHPREMADPPNPPTIIVFSREKRALDEAKPEIIYISSVEGIRPY